MISVDNLSVAFGSFTLFDNISFVVNPKDKIALVGKNGAGKSTMLKIFAGLQAPTGGNVVIPKDVTIGYLPQHMIHADGKTVLQEAETAFEHVKEMQAEIEHLTTELSERTDYDSAEYAELIERLTVKNEQMQTLGLGNFRAEVEKTLIGLGFERSDFDRDTSEFSGG